jgi:hypothetical protein
MIDQSLFDPDAVQAQQLDNRQRLAQMMVQQGMDERVYSPAAGIAKALTIALGNADAGRAERSMMALAQQKQATHQAELANIIAAATGGQGNTSDVPGGGPPVSMANPGVSGCCRPGCGDRPRRWTLRARQAPCQLPRPADFAGWPRHAAQGSGRADHQGNARRPGRLSPDGMHVLNKIGGAKIAPPNVADVTPESLAKYQQSGDPRSSCRASSRCRSIPATVSSSSTPRIREALRSRRP